ncbi:restriction endonuclease subunit S [Vibrio vulnificus]|uniref:restriction endonuclease subunit S n=2 Tax=Vibrio vulnificus TaxID=672 RepID=UPI000CD1B7D5|nr:restriction endonuclease subunit S [Vibrio vulnificus]MCU8267651.1 restriction endonuclease subunit S [Vibrio vulnificus]POB50708.1 hypothetical protein CRN26_20290 [Vibrio vulnificus]
MRSNYKKLGQFIREVSVKNKDLSVELLLGVSITKQFIPSIANTVGTDMSNYKVVEHHQFAYGPVTSRNGEKISVALLGEEKCIVSTSYTVFEIVDTELLDPEYLMMWFRRSEFDRYARYMSHGTVRELFGWQEMCDVELPVPSIEKQREIVREYNVVNDRIALNEQLTQKLEDTAQAIYKQWFVDFEFPISKEYAESIGKPELEGKPYKSSGGEMKTCENLEMLIPKDWHTVELEEIATEKKESFKLLSGFSTLSYIGLEHMPKKSISLKHWDNITSIGSNKSKFYEGDILFGKLRPYFHKVGIAFVDGICSTDIIVCQAKERNFFGFVLSLMSSVAFVDYANSGWSGTKMPRTSWAFMSKYKFAIPMNTQLIEQFNQIVTMQTNYLKHLANENRTLSELSGIINIRMSKA